MMFLEAIPLTRTLPCLAEPGKIIVIGQPGKSLSDVIPYLAALPGVLAYNPETLTLTFRRPRGFMTLYTDKVYITQVSSVEEGLQLLASLTEAINATWEHRAELKRVETVRRAPRPLDIWTLLPRTNCKQCGEATCMAFAVGLLQHRREIGECFPLTADPALSDRRAALAAILG